MFKCSDEIIQRYLDGELTAEEMRYFKVHLSQCQRCNQKIEFWKKIESYRSEYFKDNVSKDISASIMNYIKGHSLKEAGFSLSEDIFNLLKWKYVFAIIILVLIPVFIIFNSSKKVMVTFKVTAENAHRISLVGDFNNWDLNASKLNKTNGSWEITIPVKPGKYQYTLIIDGKKWLLDPQEEVDFNKNMELYFISTDEEENNVAAVRG